ncbi:MAG: hypothetical protein ACTHZX_09675 [Microbacterium sp.]
MREHLSSTLSAVFDVIPPPLQRTVARILWPGASRRAASLVPRLESERAPRLVVGPTNTAGQASAWCTALEAAYPAAQARSMELVPTSGRNSFVYPSDLLVPAELKRGRLAWEKGLLQQITHALLERASSITALSSGLPSAQHLQTYARSGVTAGLLIHGTEMRDPQQHLNMYEASPFRDHARDFPRLAEHVAQTRNVIDESGLRTFVTTPDMLDFVPGATLVPVVVDVDAHTAAAETPALTRQRPVVLHAPSNPALKGTATIEPVLEALEAAGRIRYKRVQSVPNSAMPSLIGKADVVVDQIALGNVGVLAAEAMAAGRLVVAHVHERVRLRTGGNLPVVDATPTTFSAVMREILDDRDRFTDIAAAGPSWARSHHDGRASAGALAPFLGL